MGLDHKQSCKCQICQTSRLSRLEEVLKKTSCGNKTCWKRIGHQIVNLAIFKKMIIDTELPKTLKLANFKRHVLPHSVMVNELCSKLSQRTLVKLKFKMVDYLVNLQKAQKWTFICLITSCKLFYSINCRTWVCWKHFCLSEVLNATTWMNNATFWPTLVTVKSKTKAYSYSR